MTAAFVQQQIMAFGSRPTPITTTALSAGTTAGTTVIVCVETTNDMAVTGISGGSGTFVAREQIYNATDGSVEIWEGTGVTAGTTQFTIAFASTPAVCGIQIMEFSGLVPTGAFDRGATSGPITSGSAVVPTIIPTATGDLFIAAGVFHSTTNSATATNGYTDVGGSGVKLDAAYLIPTDDIAHSTAWAIAASNAWLTAGAAFLALPPPPLDRPTVTSVLHGDTIEITVTSTVTVPGGSTLTGTVIRSDGVYVLGASPRFPAALVGDTVTVVDSSGAYGQSYSYVANLTLTTPPDTLAYSPPSIPSALLTLPLAPDQLDLYQRMGWAYDEDSSGELLLWLTGLGLMMQGLDDLCRDQLVDGVLAPGWSQILDIDRVPTYVLPWLAQFVGVTLDPTLRDDQQRYLIQNPSGFQRGTPGAILAAINQYLAPGFTATISERDTSPYHLTITIPTGGIASQITCLELSQEYGTYAALITNFPTYRSLWKSAATGGGSGASNYFSLWQTLSTYAQIYSTFSTYADIWATDRLIDNAVAESVPAGLVVQLVYA